MNSIVSSVKGTRDFYPEDMAFRTWLYQKIREVSALFGYIEYDGPFLEKIDLYAAKSGEELVKEQAFVFQDRGGDYISLRPELTPSLARMIAQRQKQLVFPQRWWSFGPFWRYERPQKGRTREFFQWNIDLLGTDSIESDAELVAICATFFKLVGLRSDQVKIFVNSRQLMDQLLVELKIPKEKKQDVFRLIDRRDKLSTSDWDKYAFELGLSQEQLNGLKEILQDEDIWKKSEQMTNLFKCLEAFDVMEYIEYDPQIIRGLDYYTGMVFEARDIDKEGRAILGGGHYGNLVADVGGDPLPGVGFAMGDVMARLILEKYECVPTFPESSAQVLVTVFNEELQAESIRLSSELRAAGITTICLTEISKLPKQFKYADRIGVPLVVVLGPDEFAKGEVSIKNLLTRAQSNVKREVVAEELIKWLADNQSV